MTTMKTRIAFLTAALAGFAVSFGGCAGQPNAGCPVSTSNPAGGVPPYWVKYTKLTQTGTGTCGTLPGEAIGFQKYNKPGTKEIRLAYTVEGLGGPYAEDRRDPTDPDGKKINGFGQLPPVPNATNYCEVTDFTGAGQNFEEIPAVPLADGGSEPAVPALSLKYEFTNLKFLATVNAPGTVFTGELKRTEDACVATFTTLGLWPRTACDPMLNEPNGYSLECDPNPRPDAGHILGSGINPTFSTTAKPITCGKAGFCEISLTVDEIAKL